MKASAGKRKRMVIRAMQDSIGAHEDAVDRETEEEPMDVPSPGLCRLELKKKSQ
jgi:hypothetical protein